MRTHSVLLMVAGLFLPVVAAPATPAGWFLAGSDPGSYVVERDPTVTHDGKKSASLASTRTPKGFGTLMQSIAATDYRGKRLRLTAWVKANGVKNWAGVWMRVDADGPKTTAFDNMQNRPIKGTKAWTRYDVVLDVAENATGISFGILLEDVGTVWISDVQFQVVDDSVPTTSSGGATPNRKPENLDFSR